MKELFHSSPVADGETLGQMEPKLRGSTNNATHHPKACPLKAFASSPNQTFFVYITVFAILSFIQKQGMPSDCEPARDKE